MIIARVEPAPAPAPAPPPDRVDEVLASALVRIAATNSCPKYLREAAAPWLARRKDPP